MTINKITGEILDDETASLNMTLAQADVNALMTDEVLEMFEQYEIAKARYDEWVRQHDEIIMNAMKESGLKTIKTQYVTFTYVSPSVRKSIDSKKLKEEKPDIYNQYLRESTVRESLRITDRKD